MRKEKSMYSTQYLVELLEVLSEGRRGRLHPEVLQAGRGEDQSCLQGLRQEDHEVVGHRAHLWDRLGRQVGGRGLDYRQNPAG